MQSLEKSLTKRLISKAQIRRFCNKPLSNKAVVWWLTMTIKVRLIDPSMHRVLSVSKSDVNKKSQAFTKWQCKFSTNCQSYRSENDARKLSKRHSFRRRRIRKGSQESDSADSSSNVTPSGNYVSTKYVNEGLRKHSNTVNPKFSETNSKSDASEYPQNIEADDIGLDGGNILGSSVERIWANNGSIRLWLMIKNILECNTLQRLIC